MTSAKFYLGVWKAHTWNDPKRSVSAILTEISGTWRFWAATESALTLQLWYIFRLQLLQKWLLIVTAEWKLCTYVYSSLHFRNIQGSTEIFADT